MNGNQNKKHGLTEKLHLRLSQGLMARLEYAAELATTEAATVTPSDLARLALDRYLPLLPLAGAVPMPEAAPETVPEAAP
jgi:hypothetical protein